MKKKCDNCNRPATHHSVEIIKGKKIEKHLCDEHAAEEGLAIKAVHTPINELLTNFVKLQSGMSAKQEDAECDECGMTWSEFREHSLLGCPHCYDAFDDSLGPLLERAHDGATHHIGKTPSRAGSGVDRQNRLLALRKRLDDAVDREDYETAAKLRDDIRGIEEETGE